MTSGARRISSEIAAVFEQVPIPDTKEIPWCDYGCDPADADQLRKDFGGKHWRDILRNNFEWFRKRHDALIMMSPAAFRSYLPAFLIKVLEKPRDLDLVPDWVVYALEPPGEEHFQAMHLARIQGLDRRQRQVIVKFLRQLERELSDECPNSKNIGRALKWFQNHMTAV